ncbi:MAG: SMP-30/gluconolactonase/LRE family protein [Imperialibacter sp.]
MKKSIISLLSLFIALFSCSEKKSAELFKATDFTAENLFTNNIEGPAFDAEGNLYVVNFGKDGTIGKVNAAGTASLFLTLPEGSTANSIKFGNDGTMYLADYTGHNVLAVDMATKAVSTFAHNDNFNQPNDLCIDSRGRLYASDPNWADKTGQIWRIDVDGTTVLLDSAMGTTNGIELSPDEKTLYVNESVQLKIWAFDVDANGDISNKREFASFDDFGFDGMKSDKEGNLYVARYGKGVIAVLSSAGELTREVALTGKKCSNLVFGGVDGKTVFVTLQDRKGMEKFQNDVPGKGY